MPPEPDGGLVTAERLRAAHPEIGLLFLSHYAESHYLMRILQIGTDSIGYRLKEKVGSVEVLTDTLTRIADGEIVIEPMLAKRLVERPRDERKSLVSALSEREIDVLRLMAEGRSNTGSPGSCSSRPRPSRNTSRTSSASSGCTPTPGAAPPGARGPDLSPFAARQRDERSVGAYEPGVRREAAPVARRRRLDGGHLRGRRDRGGPRVGRPCRPAPVRRCDARGRGDRLDPRAARPVRRRADRAPVHHAVRGAGADHGTGQRGLARPGASRPRAGARRGDRRPAGRRLADGRGATRGNRGVPRRG